VTDSDNDGSKWLKSAEIRKKLKLTTCELAHLREAGKLPFKKKGNAYLYLAEDATPSKLKRS